MHLHDTETHESAQANLDAPSDLDFPEQDDGGQGEHDIGDDGDDGLGDDDAQQLRVRETFGGDLFVPGPSSGVALEDPQ